MLSNCTDLVLRPIRRVKGNSSGFPRLVFCVARLQMVHLLGEGGAGMCFGLSRKVVESFVGPSPNKIIYRLRFLFCAGLMVLEVWDVLVASQGAASIWNSLQAGKNLCKYINI